MVTTIDLVTFPNSPALLQLAHETYKANHRYGLEDGKAQDLPKHDC